MIAIVSIAALLLVAQFAYDTANDDPSSASAIIGASATNGTAPERVASSPANESRADLASNSRVDEAAPPASGSGRENEAGRETLAAGATAPPAADSAADPAVERKPDPKPGSVAAECWGLRGSAPTDFMVTLDRDVRTSGDASALISSRRETSGYATMFQTAAAAPVRGKRVEFSADIRTRGATGGANLLLRAEDASGHTVAFDNMVTSYVGDQRPYKIGNRGITGNSEWSTHHVVVDIPDEARVITYGLSMFGSGKAWIDNARIEVVSNDVATTALDIRQSPEPPHGMPINPASLTRSPRNLEFDLEAQAGAAPCN